MTRFLPALTIAVFAASLPALDKKPAEDKKYESPYSVAFTHADLIGDITSGKRGAAGDESSVPHAEWNSKAVREKYGSWGPPARHFPAPAGLAGKSAGWKRERVIAVGMRYVGYGYQHHHIPDWLPPEDGPHGEKGGHHAKGVDCSNFTSFVYNLAFGLKPSSDIKAQSALKEFPGPGDGHTTAVRRIELPDRYDDFPKTLKTGDLLYVKNLKGELSHVVLWVGAVGRSPNGVPLILDSHGDGVKDSDGQTIPSGVHLRPFRDKSWYYKSASHAIRVFPDE